MLSYVLPCNPFPVTEEADAESGSLLAQAIKTGYQSHYVRVNQKGKIGDEYDEIIVNQESQILPAYIITLDVENVAQMSLRMVTTNLTTLDI